MMMKSLSVILYVIISILIQILSVMYVKNVNFLAINVSQLHNAYRVKMDISIMLNLKVVKKRAKLVIILIKNTNNV